MGRLRHQVEALEVAGGAARPRQRGKVQVSVVPRRRAGLTERSKAARWSPRVRYRRPVPSSRHGQTGDEPGVQGGAGRSPPGPRRCHRNRVAPQLHRRVGGAERATTWSVRLDCHREHHAEDGLLDGARRHRPGPRRIVGIHAPDRGQARHPPLGRQEEETVRDEEAAGGSIPGLQGAEPARTRDRQMEGPGPPGRGAARRGRLEQVGPRPADGHGLSDGAPDARRQRAAPDRSRSTMRFAAPGPRRPRRPGTASWWRRRSPAASRRRGGAGSQVAPAGRDRAAPGGESVGERRGRPARPAPRAAASRLEPPGRSLEAGRRVSESPAQVLVPARTRLAESATVAGAV